MRLHIVAYNTEKNTEDGKTRTNWQVFLKLEQLEFTDKTYHNIKKTKPLRKQPEMEIIIRIGHEEVEEMKEFGYVGSTVTHIGVQIGI